MPPNLHVLALLASASTAIAYEDYEDIFDLMARGRDDPASIDLDLYSRDAEPEADADAEPEPDAYDDPAGIDLDLYARADDDPASLPLDLYARDASPDADPDAEAYLDFDLDMYDLQARDYDELLSSLEARGILTEDADKLLDSLGEDGEKVRELAKEWLPSLELREAGMEVD